MKKIIKIADAQHYAVDYQYWASQIKTHITGSLYRSPNGDKNMFINFCENFAK